MAFGLRISDKTGEGYKEGSRSSYSLWSVVDKNRVYQAMVILWRGYVSSYVPCTVCSLIRGFHIEGPN